MINYYIKDEPSFLYHTALLCSELRSGSDGAWQIAPFQCSIPYSEDTLDRISDLKLVIQERFPDLFRFGQDRANRAFYSRNDSITKPSYISRLLKYRHRENNQLERIVSIANKEHSSGGIVFSVFHPDDLEDRRRPGYVPCLISGTFLEHEGELQLNAFFRSQSVVEFGIFDLEFLRNLQAETVARLNVDSGRNLAIGRLNLHFARIIIQRRLMRNKQGYRRRDETLAEWLEVVERFMLTS
jgi:hypothetical protein